MKYGKEQEVQLILSEYRSFVGTRNIFQEFDRAFHEMQQVSEAYKKDTELSKTFFYAFNNIFALNKIQVRVKEKMNKKVCVRRFSKNDAQYLLGINW